MKKLLGCFLYMMLLVCLSTPVSANSLVPDDFGATGPYWDVFATNPDHLTNSGADAQRTWLEVGLLQGADSGDLVATFDWTDGPKALDEFDPGVVDWDYAIVKTGLGQTLGGESWYAYLNDYGNDLLNVPPQPDGWLEFPNGVSHVSFYGGNPVPEPTTMLLLGAGLVGLAGFGRKKFKK